MDTVVDKLLEIDRKARQSIDEAKQYHENTIAEIERERERLEQEYRRKLEAHLADVTNTEAVSQAEQIAAIRSQFEAQRIKLEAAYDDTHETWECEIFQRCIGGEQ